MSERGVEPADMDAPEQKPRTERSRWPLIGIGLGVLMAALIVWAARRDSKLGPFIDQKLAALRAAGELVDAASLAKAFPLPPKHLEAGVITNTLFPFVRTNRAPGLTPIIMSGPSLARTQSIDAQPLMVLRRHYEDSSGITNVLPVLPAGARFGTDWSVGVTEAPIVSFVSVRETIQMLSARTLYAAEIGDAEGAAAMLERSFRFANAVNADATLVEHMIRAACLKLTCTVAERSLNRLQFTDVQLARVLAALPPTATNNLLGTLRIEQCMSIWAFSHMRAGKSFDELFSWSANEPWWKRTWKRFWPPRKEYKDEDFIAYLDLIPKLLEATKLPTRDAVTEWNRLFANYGSNVTSEVAQSMIPNWSKAINHQQEIETYLETTRAALSVERFRLAHQRLPASLHELAPGFVSVTPLDPMDGQPLRFKALARGYVVYSIGLDGSDDAGLEKTTTAGQTNYDVTVTVER